MSPAKSRNMPNDNVSNLGRRYFSAYEHKDRRSAGDVLSEGFTFSSPLDDYIDKKTYFERCWPNSSKIRSLKIEKLFAAGSEVFVHYKSELFDGATFRNTELLSQATSSPQLMSTSVERCERPGILSRQLRSRLL
jgi:hypothetical protein